MVHQVIYGFRGWIAFVAFLDLGTAVQCFLDPHAFLSYLYTAEGVAEYVNPAMARLLGTHRVLSAIILTHCALCIHYKPMLSVAGFSCLLTIVSYISEALWYRTTPLNFYTLFPIATAAITIVGLYITPRFLKPPEVEAEEETNMLKMVTKRRNWIKKRT